MTDAARDPPGTTADASQRPGGGRAADAEVAGAGSDQAREAARRNTLRGILLMLLATLMFAVMHTTIRMVSADLHPFEAAFFRNLFGILIVVPWLIRYGAGPLRTGAPKLHLLRVAFNIVAMLCFFYALSIAPLAEVTALNFTAPIFAVLLAIPIFGEKVRLRRGAAIILGFVGVLVIVRPGFADVTLGQILTILSSLFWACALLVIKRLGQYDSSVTIILYMALLMIPASLIPALFFWTWPTWAQLGWLAIIGLSGNAAQLAMTEALKIADTGAVMPIDFFKLVWVALFGFVLFGEIPDIYTWIGGAIIFASTAYIALREQKVSGART